MMSSFPIDQLPAIALQIAEFLGVEGIAVPGEELTIGPPIEVWVWVPAHRESERSRISSFVRGTERFHHQVTDRRGEPIGYALTALRNSSVVISKLSRSAPAACAVENGLRDLRRRGSSERTVRLLSVPHLQLDALWSHGSSGDEEILVIKSPPELNLAEMLALSETAFVQVVLSKSREPSLNKPLEQAWSALLNAEKARLKEEKRKSRSSKVEFDVQPESGLAPRMLQDAA